MPVSLPALATGAGFTNTVTLLVLLQNPVCPVNVYMVVITGDASGVNMFGLLSPVDGVHKKELTFHTPASVVLSPSQMVTLLPAFTKTVFNESTKTGIETVQLLVSLTVMV